MGRKARPNDPCPCASGVKFKKCCGRPGGPVPTGRYGPLYTPADRGTAIAKLDAFIDEHWEEEEQHAFDEFWGRFLEREDELPPGLLATSNDVHEPWFAFDHLLSDGKRVSDHFLAQAVLTPGERAYLTAMRRASMHLYEVIDTLPGKSMTLRDLLEGVDVTVNERTGSRTIPRSTCLAARVIPRGSSGGPEMERGVLHIPDLWRETALKGMLRRREEFLRAGEPVDEFYKDVPPSLHEVWLASIFEPAIPRMQNTDGEDMVLTRVSFHIDDPAALFGALDATESEGIEQAREGAWSWAGTNAKGTVVSLGQLAADGRVLTLETNSAERGARGRALLERIAGAAIRHRGTVHEDLHRRLSEAMTAKALGKELDDEPPPGPTLDPEIQEALVAEHYARHYRSWVDEPVPALDGLTPRAAAKRPALRARVEELLRGLDGHYEAALKEGQPAYDASWMWDELALREDADRAHPPPLAHERVAERVPGSAEISRLVAERLRGVPGFEDETTVLRPEDFAADLDLQRFLRVERDAANETGHEGAAAAPYLRLMVNLDLHRRKVFWVDAALAYMLEHTDIDVGGRELRVPFPSFALVLTDRHTLGLGERLLSRRRDDPLCGQILRVITVFITEERRGDARALEVTFAFDALGADLPSLVRYEIPADSETSVRAFLDTVAPPLPVVEPPIPDVHPVRRLLRVVINAILYATSAGVTPEVRIAPPRAPRASKSPSPRSSDSVYFLPGTIDIRSVRRFQELERAPEGRATLARCMVRGHWRRPQKGWTDQRLRWIAPYWKGPDMAAVIERAYRLKV